jgi:hypothetical protein
MIMSACEIDLGDIFLCGYVSVTVQSFWKAFTTH